MKRTALALALLAGAACLAPAQAQTITAKQEDDATIRVVAPGSFETTFTKRKGFVATWFDLKHDPEKKRDLAPVWDENGILWTKLAGKGWSNDGGSWYANPAEKLELLEAGPARVRVRVSGFHCRYGYATPQAAWKELGFAQTFTLYPSGHVYIDYLFDSAKPIELHHFVLIIKSNGSWGPRGTGEGANEVHPAAESGAQRPSGATASPFLLQWSDGPTHFQDILLALYKGKYGGSYWNEGFQDKDYRTGYNIMDFFPDKTIPQGQSHMYLMMRFGDDLNGEKAAAPVAADYRAPDQLAVTLGTLDKTDPGDADADGYNETEGCYVLQAAPGGIAFTLHGAATPRFSPAFKIKGWQGGTPGTIQLRNKALARDKDFTASVTQGTLIVQLAGPIREDAAVAISAAR